jgi:hypothetical protein
MKKEKLIAIALLLVLSFKSYARTGIASDEFEFLLAIVGLLLFILGLLNGIDYTKKNGKTIIYKSISFLHEKVALLRNYIIKVKSDYFDVSSH